MFAQTLKLMNVMYSSEYITGDVWEDIIMHMDDRGRWSASAGCNPVAIGLGKFESYIIH